jgi:hypothetical protein
MTSSCHLARRGRCVRHVMTCPYAKLPTLLFGYRLIGHDRSQEQPETVSQGTDPM